MKRVRGFLRASIGQRMRYSGRARAMATFFATAALIVTTTVTVAKAEAQSGSTKTASIITPSGFRVAVLDLGPRARENSAEALAFKQMLESQGIPFIITTDVNEAILNPVVLIAGSLANATVEPPDYNRIITYVEMGGILVSGQVLGSKYFRLFGMEKPIDSQRRYSMLFEKPETDPALAMLDRPEERKISLGNSSLYTDVVWTRSFTATTATVLATTEDGKAALSVNAYGKGLAYASAVAFADVVLLPRSGGDYEAQGAWANAFEPGTDVFCLLIAGIASQACDPFVRLSAAPDGMRTALVISHDIDARESFKYSVDFAELERSLGVSGTYFVTTKYFPDESDIGYYDADRIEFMRKVAKLGGDIGSHSVSHSRRFSSFALGDVPKSLSSYVPTTQATVLGELFVSKALLDRDIPGRATVSFRAGELQIPAGLPQALARTGYRYDSSYSANDTMTNFAYRMLYRTANGIVESDIVELPVTFDDSQGMLTERNLDEAFARWSDVLWAHADNGGVSTLLIHPTVTSYKLAMEERLVRATWGRDVWIGNVTAYCDFWSARTGLDYDVHTRDGLVTIAIKSGTVVAGMTFVLKESGGASGLRYTGAEIRDASGALVPTRLLRRAGDLFVVVSPLR